MGLSRGGALVPPAAVLLIRPETPLEYVRRPREERLELSVLEIVAILGIGLLAGTINTLVGGGSFIVLPLLVFFGMPAQVANGTNRLAVFFQSLAATGSLQGRTGGKFRDGGFSDTPRPLAFAIEPGIA